MISKRYRAWGGSGRWRHPLDNPSQWSDSFILKLSVFLFRFLMLLKSIYCIKFLSTFLTSYDFIWRRTILIFILILISLLFLLHTKYWAQIFLLHIFTLIAALSYAVYVIRFLLPLNWYSWLIPSKTPKHGPMSSPKGNIAEKF
jgi:hypothetical protein